MPAHVPLFQEVCQHLQLSLSRSGLPKPSLRRLALLVTGMVAAHSSVLSRLAAELDALELTNASQPEHIERRLRRALNDGRLTAARAYEPLLRHSIDWPRQVDKRGRLVVIVDESSKEDDIHLLRISLAYRGSSLPLTWVVWRQNVPLPHGAYWAAVDSALTRLAALLPADSEVVIVADRAYDTAPWVDRVAAHGWHWVVRAKAKGSLRWRDQTGRTWVLSHWLAQHVRQPGQRAKARGYVFKDAGWRAASVVAIWGRGEAEPMVVLTDLAPRWEVVALYGRRFWCETGFRNDKRAGWQWEDSQVQGLVHQRRLLLAMAWATLLVVCLGVGEAEAHLQQAGRRAVRAVRRGRDPARPQPARYSLFRLGLRAARRWLYRTVKRPLRWWLTELTAPSWADQWYQHQSRLYLTLKSVRP